MLISRLLLSVILFFVCAAVSPSEDKSEMAILIVSSATSFDSDLKPLDFTQNDAARFADIMIKVGKVSPEKIVHLKNAKSEDLPLAMAKINEILKDENCDSCPKKFIFYFSGHADSNGLHFRDGQIGRTQLHSQLSNVKAETKIVILDSCFSGALTKKGIRKAPVFALPKADYDEPSGSIFISASSAREYSYELQDLKGSVFTYHLVAGLSGQADSSKDGVVTVDELYQYVYQETRLHSLMFPNGNRQTPEFVSRLEGRGAVALSFPSKSNARLILGSDIAGNITIASLGGIQMFKLDKPLGTKKAIQLPPGAYSFSAQQGHRVGKKKLELISKKVTSLGGEQLEWSSKFEVRKKGGNNNRESVNLEIFAGRHSGYSANQSPGLKANIGYSLISGSMFSMPYRILGSLSSQQHIIREKNDWAQAYIVKLQTESSFNIWKAFNTGFIDMTFAAGNAWVMQDWQYVDRDPRSFVASTLALEYGLSFRLSRSEQDSEFEYRLGWKRDLLFSRDFKNKQQVLSGHSIGLSILF